MRTRILLTAVAFLLVLGPATAWAQDGGEAPPGPDPKQEKKRQRGAEKMFRKMAEALGLSEEQVQKIRELKMEEMRKMREMREGQDQKIREILSPEQLTKYQELQKKMRKRAGAGAGGRRGADGGRSRSRSRDPLDILKSVGRELGLSEEQMEGVKRIGKEAQQAMLEAVEKASETGDYDGIKSKTEQIKRQVLEKVRGLLTEEQRAKFESVLRGGREALRGGMDRRGGGRRGRNPREMMKFRMQEIQKSLNLLPEEAMIIMPKVEEIIKAQAGLMKKLGDQRKQVEELLRTEGIDEEAILKEVEIFRKLRTDEQTGIEKLQEGLRELLTVRQEVRLVIAGVLK
jgi:Spy/CpxP family protein refolding chaperone